MSKYEKTAKDRAFDRERAKLGAQIKKLQEELRKARIQIEADNAMLQNSDEIIKELEKENKLLRDMIQLKPEELERHLKEVHEKAETAQRAKEALGLLGLAKSINHY